MATISGAYSLSWPSLRRLSGDLGELRPPADHNLPRSTADPVSPSHKSRLTARRAPPEATASHHADTSPPCEPKVPHAKTAVSACDASKKWRSREFIRTQCRPNYAASTGLAAHAMSAAVLCGKQSRLHGLGCPRDERRCVVWGAKPLPRAGLPTQRAVSLCVGKCGTAPAMVRPRRLAHDDAR
jgi:hypothetical protein